MPKHNDDKIQQQTNKRRDTRKRHSLFRVRYIFVVIFILVYAQTVFSWLFTRSIPTGVIMHGSVEQSIDTTVVLMRDEVLLTSDIDGRFLVEIPESGRVPRDGTVVEVINSDGVALSDQIISLNEEIFHITMESSQDPELHSAQLRSTNAALRSEVRRLVANSFSTPVVHSDNVRREINSILEQRGHLLQNIVETPEVQALQAQVQALEEQRYENAYTITAPASGVVSYVLDQRETQLNIAHANKLTEAMYHEIIHERRSESAQDKMATRNEPFAKLITSRYVILGFYVDNSDAAYFSRRLQAEDPRVTVRVRELGKSVSCEIISVIPPSDTSALDAEEDGRTLVLLRCYNLLASTSRWRTLQVEIVLQSIDGFKVPTASLLDYRLHGETARVMLVKRNYTVLKDVRLLASNDQYAIIEPVEHDSVIVAGNDALVQRTYQLLLFDRFVLNPQNVQEGHVLSR